MILLHAMEGTEEPFFVEAMACCQSSQQSSVTWDAAVPSSGCWCNEDNIIGSMVGGKTQNLFFPFVILLRLLILGNFIFFI